jgi:hypothetical protein
MSHLNIYKKSSKSSLQSSRASLQDHTTGTKKSEQFSKTSLHDRSSGTSLGQGSLHLSSADYIDVFQENTVEKSFQKSTSSVQQSNPTRFRSDHGQSNLLQAYQKGKGRYNLYGPCLILKSLILVSLLSCPSIVLRGFFCLFVFFGFCFCCFVLVICSLLSYC